MTDPEYLFAAYLITAIVVAAYVRSLRVRARAAGRLRDAVGPREVAPSAAERRSVRDPAAPVGGPTA